jgi:hypothetical protein
MAEPRKEQIGMVGIYDDVDAFLRAAESVRDTGHTKWDCHTPYPVHGLDRAMGLRVSPVANFTLTGGLIGFLGAIAMTWGLSVWHYPIRIGGKALFSWQAFVPIYFEMFVLFAALSTMGALLFLCRLGKWHSPLHDSGVMAEIVRDRYAIALEATDDGHTDEFLTKLLEDAGCRDIRPLVQLEEEETSIL